MPNATAARGESPAIRIPIGVAETTWRFHIEYDSGACFLSRMANPDCVKRGLPGECLIPAFLVFHLYSTQTIA